MSSSWLQILHHLITTYVYKKSTVFFISKLDQLELTNLHQQLYKYYKLKNPHEGNRSISLTCYKADINWYRSHQQLSSPGSLLPTTIRDTPGQRSSTDKLPSSLHGTATCQRWMTGGNYDEQGEPNFGATTFLRKLNFPLLSHSPGSFQTCPSWLWFAAWVLCCCCFLNHWTYLA